MKQHRQQPTQAQRKAGAMLAGLERIPGARTDLTLPDDQVRLSQQPPATDASDVLRAERERLAGKERELDERATAAASRAEAADQRYVDLGFAADVHDDVAAAAACDAARDEADSAKREQRRAEASAKRLKGELVALDYRIRRAVEREAYKLNGEDLDAVLLPLATEVDQDWSRAMEGLGRLIEGLRTCAGRLTAADLPDAANTLLYTRMRTLRDVIIWSVYGFNFSGRRILRPPTHAAQRITFAGAVSGQQSVPPIAQHDVAAVIDAALAAVTDEPPDVLAEPTDPIAAREAAVAATTTTH